MKPSHPVWEIRDLHDGRIGIFRDGICQATVRSTEEVREWMDARRPRGPDREAQGIALDKALRR